MTIFDRFFAIGDTNFGLDEFSERRLPNDSGVVIRTTDGNSVATRLGRYVHVWNMGVWDHPEIACRAVGRVIPVEEWLDPSRHRTFGIDHDTCSEYL